MKYRFETFQNWEEFTKATKDIADEGWRLHSWQITPFGVNMEMFAVVYETEKDFFDRQREQMDMDGT